MLMGSSVGPRRLGTRPKVNVRVVGNLRAGFQVKKMFSILQSFVFLHCLKPLTYSTFVSFDCCADHGECSNSRL